MKVFILVAFLAMAAATPTPAKPAFWKGTPMDNMVNEMRSGCEGGNDAIACMKFKVMNLLDTIFKKDSYQISETVEVVRNNDVTARSASGDVLDAVEDYIQSHDVTFKLPVAGAKVTLSPRMLEEDQLNLNIQFADENTQGARASGVEPRKSKLKKIIVPILVFVLLKAMTLVPLALGVLGLKAWNALQLSFFSFVTSVALAIFQLCKKIAADNSHPQITHGPWDSMAAAFKSRSIEEPQPQGQNLAYNAYL